jgi:hypothetical protein
MTTLARRMRSFAIGAVAVLVAVGASFAATGARADAASACTTTSGVTVIVDFSHWGGGVARGCAPGAPATGLEALQKAGFAPTGTTRYGLAFVCRIDGKPGVAENPCTDTPPASAYWAYYHAAAGAGGWTKSTLGAYAYRPAPGSIEGWAFGASALPSVAPSIVSPPPPSTAPPVTAKPPVHHTPPPTTKAAGNGGSPSPVTAASTARGAGTSPSAPTAGAGTHASGPTTTTPGGKTGAPATTATSDATGAKSTKTKSDAASASASASAATNDPEAGDASGASRIVDREASPANAASRSDSGSPLPFVLTGIVLAACAVGAVVIARARRRRPA